MKKVFLALMCIASMALIAACGGNANKTEENTDEVAAAEQGAKSFDQMTGIEKCAEALQRTYNLNSGRHPARFRVRRTDRRL